MAQIAIPCMLIRGGTSKGAYFLRDDLPADLAARDAVAAAGRKREANEDEKRRRLASGELGLDMYAMREGLAKAGLVYRDEE